MTIREDRWLREFLIIVLGVMFCLAVLLGYCFYLVILD